jgi:hypothetical protein
LKIGPSNIRQTAIYVNLWSQSNFNDSGFTLTDPKSNLDPEKFDKCYSLDLIAIYCKFNVLITLRANKSF